MTVKKGQVYQYPRHDRRAEIVSAGQVWCAFSLAPYPVPVEMSMLIEHMQHWDLIRDICDHCGELYPVTERSTVPDPSDDSWLAICPDCHTSRAFLDRAGDEAEVRY